MTGIHRPGVFSILAFSSIIFAGITLTTALYRTPATAHAQDGKPRLYLDRAIRVETSYRRGLLAQAVSLSLASDDFDGDGINDLAVGFETPTGGVIAIHRGNLDAFAPQSEASFGAIARSEFPSPYLPEAQVIEIPSRPDFLASGDFIGQNGTGVVAAARGGRTLRVLARGESGKVELLQSIDVPGAITALGAHPLRSGKYAQIVVGVQGANGPELLIYTGSNEGVSAVARFSLTSEATSFAFGNLDGDGSPDVLVVAGGTVSILHGTSQTLDAIEVPFTVARAVVGNFVFDRDPFSQIALLATDGSLHILGQSALDARPFSVEEVRARRQSVLGQGIARTAPALQRSIAWKEIESYSNAGTFDGSGAPLMFRTRISSNAADDVMLLGSTRLSVVAHPDRNPASGVIMDRNDLAADAVAALPARVNIDGRPGVVFLKRGDVMPHVMMPLPDPTFTVNRLDDPTPMSPITNACNGVANDCSLREAVLKANATSGTDTVMLPAGTYSLTIGRPASPDYTGNHGALYLNDSVNIIGAGQNTTIIQWGTPGSGTVDMVIAVNEDLNPLTDASASISNLTIQNGVNHGTTGVDGDGGCMEYDTGTSGNANLSLTNVTLNNCRTTQGNGGGIALFNFLKPSGTGAATVVNSVFQNSSAVSAAAVGTGGGLWVSQSARLTMSNSQVINNQATQVSTDGKTAGSGGGITTTNNVPNSPQVAIHSSTISGNQAAGLGGGLDIETNLLVDQGTVISNNSAGSANKVNEIWGGGIFMDTVAPDVVTLTNVSIVGNSATGMGGGIFTGSNSGAGPLAISFSRLALNTATGTPASGNLNNNDTTVTATDNWWGTNTPLNTITTTGGSGTTTVAPFIPLSITASPTSITLPGTSTLTASFLKDSNGTAIAATNLTVLLGLPITFDNAVHGSLSGAQTTIQPAGTATVTFTGATVGLGTADAVIDGFTLTSTPKIAINAPTTTTASNASATFSESNQTITLSATIASSGGTVNGGTVTFTVFNGATQIGSAAISGAASSGNASASYTLPANTSVGTYSIHASYSGTSTGTGDFLSSNDTSHNLAVTAAATTTAAANASAPFSASSQTVALSATVTSPAGSVGAGTVTFTVLNGGSPVGSPVTSGTVTTGAASASFALPGGTSAGPYTIQAVYNPSPNFLTSSDSAHTLTVNSASTTTAALDASATFSATNQNLTLSATVTSAAGTVGAGTVTFGVFNGATAIGSPVTSGSVTGGSASATYVLPGGTSPGSYSLHATYNAGGNFATSSDNAHHLTVSQASSTTTAANSSTTFSASSQIVPLSAVVTSTTTVNEGTVTFTVKSGGSTVGAPVTSGTISAGSASANFTLPGGTAAGSYTTQAVYNPGADFTSSSDTTHTLSVGKSTPTITWSNPADIVFGSALSSQQLNATASMPGTFVYNPAAGAVLPAGSSEALSVQFTPNDAADFSGASKSVTINVTQAAGPATLVTTQTLARDSVTNEVVVTLTVANTGGTAATGVQVSSAKIGSTSTTTALPAALADITAGGSSSVVLRFPAAVGTAGARAVLAASGGYSGGSFGGSFRITLP